MLANPNTRRVASPPPKRATPCAAPAPAGVAPSLKPVGALFGGVLAKMIVEG